MKDLQLSELGRICAKALSLSPYIFENRKGGGGLDRIDHAMDVNEAGTGPWPGTTQFQVLNEVRWRGGGGEDGRGGEGAGN